MRHPPPETLTPGARLRRVLSQPDAISASPNAVSCGVVPSSRSKVVPAPSSGQCSRAEPAAAPVPQVGFPSTTIRFAWTVASHSTARKGRGEAQHRVKSPQAAQMEVCRLDGRHWKQCCRGTQGPSKSRNRASLREAAQMPPWRRPAPPRCCKSVVYTVGLLASLSRKHGSRRDWRGPPCLIREQLGLQSGHCAARR